MKVFVSLLFILCAGIGFSQFESADNITLDGITFSNQSGKLYVPIRRVEKPLKVYVGWDNENRNILIDDKPIPKEAIYQLFDGSNLVDVDSLSSVGLKVEKSKEGLKVSSSRATVEIVSGKQSVEISLKDQRLMAWQGDILVMSTNVSTGKRGFSTPVGEYTAGPEKSRHRTSSKYDDAPMPWAIQLKGGYFIHGSASVPKYPASHGCVRMPYRRGPNAAKYLFDWINLGTQIEIRREWSEVALSFIERDSEIEARKGSL